MSHEKYLCCDKCYEKAYVSKNGYLCTGDNADELINFLKKHEYDCEGNLYCADESWVCCHPEKRRCIVCGITFLVDGALLSEMMYPTKKCLECQEKIKVLIND